MNTQTTKNYPLQSPTTPQKGVKKAKVSRKYHFENSFVVCKSERCNKTVNRTGSLQLFCSPRCASYERQKRRNNGKLGGPSQAYKTIILSIFDFECQICDSKENLRIHHITAKSQGGQDHILNITVLCQKCHLNLHHKVFDKLLEEKYLSQNLCSICGKPVIRIRKSGLCLFCETEAFSLTEEDVL